MTPPDNELLEKFRKQNHQPSFTELVNRHLGLVHSAALRITGQAALAEEVSQLVFMKLARMRSPLKAGHTLVNWLYLTARSTAIDLVRSEKRRRRREETAASLAPSSESNFPWNQVSPLIDEIIGKLSQDERQVILCRYFQGQSNVETARSLGLSEDAVRMRANRALEKVRGFLGQRGIRTTATALTAALPAQAITAVPTGLAASISITAATAAATSISIPFITLLFITMTKKAIVITAALLLTGAGIAYYVASKSEPSSKAELRTPTASADSHASQGAEEGSTQRFRSKDRPNRNAASAAEAGLIARYGASRVKMAKRIAAKRFDMIGEEGLGGMISTIGSYTTKEHFSELSESIALMDGQKAKLKPLLEKIKSRDAMALQKLMNYLRSNTTPITETILASDAFKRGEITKEEYKALCDRWDSGDVKLEEELKDLKFATSVGSLLKDEDFTREFTPLLDPTQVAKLEQLKTEGDGEPEESPFDSVKSLTSASETGQSLEDAEKEVDKGTKMIMGIKEMLTLVEELGGDELKSE